jgi:hypothetical protein
MNQLDQLALWLTLEAEPLPAIGAGVGLAGRAEMHAVADPARMEVVPADGFRGGWWILGAAVVAVVAGVAGVAVWRWRRRSLEGTIPQEPVLWLEVERPMRLGGPHSGGSGAVVGW